VLKTIHIQAKVHITLNIRLISWEGRKMDYPNSLGPELVVQYNNQDITNSIWDYS
jgi:hypothetical protein